MAAEQAARLAIDAHLVTFEPTKMEAPMITREGIVELTFSQDLVVPSFIRTGRR
jgi:hypothetical protein